MTMKSIYKLSAVFVLCVTTVGCAGMPVALAPSTSPVAPGTRGTIPAFGSDCQFYLLGVIPVTHSTSTQVALDKAKQMSNSDVLTDVTVDFVGGYYILFSNNCVRVQGRGIPRGADTKSPAREDRSSNPS
jgi:hypothetical protein